MESLGSGVSANFTSSPWDREGGPWGSAGWASALRSDIAGGRSFLADEKALRRKGLNNKAFEYLVSRGGPEALAQMASLSRAKINEYERLYGIRQHVAQRAGHYAGNEVYGAELRQSNAHLAALNAKVDRLERDQREATRELKHLRDEQAHHAKRTGDAVGDKINKASRAGERGGRPVIK